jgi:hypothetical protein
MRFGTAAAVSSWASKSAFFVMPMRPGALFRILPFHQEGIQSGSDTGRKVAHHEHEQPTRPHGSGGILMSSYERLSAVGAAYRVSVRVPPRK